jgi:hypothetical protein
VLSSSSSKINDDADGDGRLVLLEESYIGSSTHQVLAWRKRNWPIRFSRKTIDRVDDNDDGRGICSRNSINNEKRVTTSKRDNPVN